MFNILFGNIRGKPEDITKKLSEQYSTSFSTPDPNFSLGDPKVFFLNEEGPDNNILNDFIFTKEMIAKEICNI